MMRSVSVRPREARNTWSPSSRSISTLLDWFSAAMPTGGFVKYQAVPSMLCHSAGVYGNGNGDRIIVDMPERQAWLCNFEKGQTASDRSIDERCAIESGERRLVGGEANSHPSASAAIVANSARALSIAPATLG